MAKNNGSRKPSEDQEEADDEAFLKKGANEDSDDWMADEDADPMEDTDLDIDEDEEENDY
ncbi:MAG: hypothetical protein KGI73_02240 [Patescibacteria group bacterium]|nr:hypothetical protein [Patescibacteria group bacterium]